MKKRVLSMFMALALCLTLLPTAAFAEGEDVSISGGVIGGGETGGEGGGIYVDPGSPTEGGGGTYISGEDTRTEIWCTMKPSLIERNYDGTTDGSTIPIDLGFTDGTNTYDLKEGTGFTAKKTFDSADAGKHKVTVEITLTGETAKKYKLRAGEEEFEINGNINKAYPHLTVSLSQTTCTVGEKILPLLSVSGVQENAAVTYYYAPVNSGYLEFEGTKVVPAIDENTAISDPGTYYVYAKTAETTNYEEDRSAIVALTVSNDVASVTTSSGVTNNYTSLDDALNAAQNGDTVTLLSDVDLGETYVTIDKSITFDLGSKTLSSSKTWSSDGVLLVKDAAVTVKNGTVNATGIGNCAIHAYRSGASMTLEDVTATVTSDKSSVMVGDFGSAVIKSGDYQGLYVGAKSQVTLEGGTFRPYMDNITNKNVKSIFWKVNETTDATSRDCMELLGDGCVYVDETGTQVRTGGGFNTVVTVQQGTAIDAPVAKIGDVEYASLSKAINAVQNGGTITLLDDLDLGNGAVLQVGSSKKDFTIDLDSHTLSADGARLIMLHNGSQLTLKNGTLDGSSCTSYNGVLYISSKSGPKLTLENVTAKSGSAADSLNGQRSVLLAYVTYGTVVFDGGVYTGGVLLETNGNAVLKSGTFQKGTNDYSIKTKDSGKHLSDYLDDDSQFWNDNTPLNLSNETQTADEVTVRPCEHKWENGKCTVCQKVCDHGSADGKSMTEDPCPTCGMKAAAQVDITGSDAKYFPSFTDALVYATKNNGCTLKLLANVTDSVSINTPFIFDLNGHDVNMLSVGARATIKDSGTKKGKIGKVTVSTHKVTDLTLGDLLEEGYAFQYENGSWANDSHLQTSAGLSVTVRKAPIQSVAVYAKDKNHKEVSTIAYGTTGEVTLVSSCRMGETSGADLSYLWYKLEGLAATAPLEGATGANYTLPDNLTAGTHTYLLICTSGGYSKSAEITITVTKIDLANAQVTIEPWHADGKFRFYPYASETAALSFLSAVKVTANGKEDTLSDSDFTYTGATATQVGNYKLTITATDSCAKYKGSKTFDWEVIPYQLWRPIFQGSQTYTKTYDGTTTLPGSYTWLAEFFGREGTDQNVTLKSGDYEVTAAEFVSADAGENKPINQTITLKNENFVFSPTEIVNVKGITTTDKTLTYTNFTPKEAYPTGGTTFNIEKAPMPDFDKEVTLDIVNNHADTYTVDLSALLPKLESPRTYGEIEYSQPTVQLASGYYTDGHAKVENGKLILTIDKNPVTTTGSIGTVTVEVKSTNYKPVTLAVNLRSVNKRKLGMFVSVATDPIVYGMTLGDIKLSAEATDGDQVIPGTIAWEDPLTTVPAAGRATYRWTFTPDDTMHYLTASNTITFLVDKATPTGDPIYTKITAANKTLKDAALKPNTSWPTGTIQWVDKDGKELPDTTEVKANTAYKWIFTPDAEFAANYTTATGELTLYSVSTGGGGGGSSSGSTVKTGTVTNPDGSVTKTETKSDGTVVETTTGKDGSTTKTETKKDGSSVTETKAADGSTGTVKTDKNGNTEAETKVSTKAVEDAKKSGEAVKAPVEVKATRNSDTAPTVKIELPRNSGETKVEIPVSNVKPGTVAVLVHPDGTEEIIKNSLPTEDGIQLTVNGGATVKIVDNSKDFIDTRSHWAKDAIDFVSARELVNGMNDSIYAPNNSTTRAQLWTILARQNDADLNGGNTWYEKAQLWSKNKGISDGTEPNAAINRAQMVTMLWRTMGQPTAGGTTNFTDVPADSYYASAVAWAVENGITDGVGGGHFDPNSTCTRAQIATFLWRAMAE
ncbi:S-layer homology domain-containing protein [Agathobaculum butyriciproducens]|uniref:S-layer homology domain-containing protein n=1 Tax=Agathobaculum butyriciproducens TaxID=1628085 RepID=A0AAW4W457_9FIRM|nr:S-layer homology domain-containing protein [Agathobaculum butyriciproducens]